MRNKLVRILSIDGGGIRGLIPATLLASLEMKLQKKAENPNVRLADYFDLIAGTSTGGIIACALLVSGDEPKRPKFTAEDVANLYFERGDEIFDVPTWKKITSVGGIIDEKYPSFPIEEVLKDYFGNCRLSELLRPTLICAYDVKKSEPHFFKQHQANLYGTINLKEDFLVRDVARATSAAPTYFEAAKVKSLSGGVYPLIDGGIYINNPALSAYAEARKIEFEKCEPSRISFPTAAEMVIVSLGTGSSFQEYSYNEIKDWGAVQWVKPLINMMMTGVSKTVDYQLKQIYDAVKRPRQYIRLEPDIKYASTDMDCGTIDNLKKLREDGLYNAKIFDKELDHIVELISTQTNETYTTSKQDQVPANY